MSRPTALIDFVAPHGSATPLRLAFGAPRLVLRADHSSEVRAVLDAVEHHAREGRWCVGFVSYEAAPAFDAAFEVHPPGPQGATPLAWFAVHDSAQPWEGSHAPHASYSPLLWQPLLDRSGFDRRVQEILQAIAEGEAYQVNFTGRLESAFEGCAIALFEALLRAQPQGYAAYLDTGELQVLSVSPELFFDWRGSHLLSRPMKGTAPRGATPEADAAAAQRLCASEKERAENLMIVDLIRNDLSRLAEPFSVSVPSLFHTQAWPTIWQMTSDVVCATRAGTRLSDVFAALFPCGSVTGAPKVRAMHWIRQLEAQPRGVYCGAVGVVQPGGAATFNVPIRTVTLAAGRARCGIGSGITADARAEAEWQEWRSKQAFLQRASRPFDLLETLRLEGGQYPAATLHLARMTRAAAHFGHPWSEASVRAELAALAAQHPHGAWRVRLLLDAHGRARAQACALESLPGPLRVQLATEPMRAPLADFLQHKTTRREHYEHFAPRNAAVFDTLLWNEQGELTEFTRGNVAVKLSGRWLTPPVHCGLLPGVGRAQALAQGRIEEAVIPLEALHQAEGLAFINSLRGWIEVELASPLAPTAART